MVTTLALIAYLQDLIPLNIVPDMLYFDDTLWQEMDALWQQSIADLDQGLVVEWGALLEIRQGHLRLAKPRKGTADSLRLVMAPSISFVGSFHTHPEAEGHTGIGFSGSDFADMINQGERISLVQSGQDIFMLLRTKSTPTEVSVRELRTRMNDRFEQAYRARRSILAASLIANRALSQELSLAFFYGRAFSRFVEVYRP